MTGIESAVARIARGALALGPAAMLNDTHRRILQELSRREEFIVRAMAVGMDDAEQLLVERTDDDAHFLLKAHILGIDRGTAERILADAPQGWADWALEQAAIGRYQNPQNDRHRQQITDWAFGSGYTADCIAITAERNRREAVDSGRRHEGDRNTWYASITWSRTAWFALHGHREPKRWNR